MKFFNLFGTVLVFLGLVFGSSLSAQSVSTSTQIENEDIKNTTLIQDKEEILKAEVIKIIKVEQGEIMGSNYTTQELDVSIPGKDGATRITNDYSPLKVGDRFYIRKITSGVDGSVMYVAGDLYRLPILFTLLLIFIVLTIMFGGIQGVRGMLSLLLSLFVISYVLIPTLYAGYNAVLVSVMVASIIIIVGSYITHGVNRTTSSAVIGMIVTVITSSLCAYYAVYFGALTGYSSDEAAFLSLNTKGAIDMVGLLFGSIIIGLLGVLYDMAIGQAVAVEELVRAGTHYTKLDVYKRALRIGREHIGALVNTLAIAYVGASLPLILLASNASTPLSYIINSEIFSTEIIRILVGSIGLVLAVPFTTIVAVYMLYGRAFSHTNKHSHSHSH